MTMDPIDAFRAGRGELVRDVSQLRDVGHALRHLPPLERMQALERVVAFLQGPFAAHLMQADALRPMVEPINRRVEALAAASSSEDMELLEELLYGLHALAIAHLDAEEPTLEQRPEGELRRIVPRRDGHPSAA